MLFSIVPSCSSRRAFMTAVAVCSSVTRMLIEPCLQRRQQRVGLLGPAHHADDFPDGAQALHGDSDDPLVFLASTKRPSMSKYRAHMSPTGRPGGG